MFLKTDRVLFPQQSYNPPIGFYHEREQVRGRQVDIGLKQINQRKIPLPLEEKIKYYQTSTLPGIAVNQQLHGYARPKDRVEFNKKYQIQKTHQRDFNSQQPDMNSYYPRIELIIPRVRQGLILPPKVRQGIILEKPVLQNVLVGQKLLTERPNYADSSSIYEFKDNPLELNYKFNENNIFTLSSNDASILYQQDQSTLMHSQLIGRKQSIQDKKEQQQIFRQNAKNYTYFLQDSLEQMKLREKMSKIEILPGPGHYILNTSQMKSLSVPARFQCFNSRQSRFDTQVEKNIVGPGSYETEFNNHDSAKKVILFSTMIGRDDPNQVVQVPSIGQYNIDSSVFNKKIKDREINTDIMYQSAFGSGQIRL